MSRRASLTQPASLHATAPHTSSDFYRYIVLRFRHELAAQSEGLYCNGAALRERLIELQGNLRVLCRVRPFIPGEGSPDLAAFSPTRAELPRLRELARVTRARRAATAGGAEAGAAASVDAAAPPAPAGAVGGARAAQSPPTASIALAAVEARATSYAAAVEAARNRVASLHDGVRCLSDPPRVEVAASLPPPPRERSSGAKTHGGAKRSPPQRERAARKFAFSHVVSGEASQAEVYARAKGIALSVRTCKHNVIIFACVVLLFCFGSILLSSVFDAVDGSAALLPSRRLLCCVG